MEQRGGESKSCVGDDFHELKFGGKFIRLSHRTYELDAYTTKCRLGPEKNWSYLYSYFEYFVCRTIMAHFIQI